MATPYRDAVVLDTPVGYWKLDEVAGTVAASVNNTPALDGTYTGTYTLGAADPTVTDTGNNAITLVQTGYVDIPASALLNLRTAITIEAIIKPTNNHLGAVYNHPTATNGYNSQAEVFLDSGTIYFRLNGAGGQSDLSWNHSAYNGVRFHLVCRWDGTTQDILVNGVVVASKASTCGTLNDGPAAKAVIGHLATTNFYAFNGMLDEVAVYSTSLSNTQVNNHVNTLFPGDARLTQAVVEAVEVLTPDARLTQAVVEAVEVPSPAVRVSQEILEAVLDTLPTVRTTQVVIEVVYTVIPATSYNSCYHPVNQTACIIAAPLTDELMVKPNLARFSVQYVSSFVFSLLFDSGVFDPVVFDVTSTTPPTQPTGRLFAKSTINDVVAVVGTTRN